MTDKKLTLAEELSQIGAPVKGSKDSNVISLPLWRESKRASPHYFIHSVLFSTIKDNDREWFNQKIIYSEKGVKVEFTGEQLNQEDLALWEALLRRATPHSSGTDCTFIASSLLIELGLPVDEKEHEELHSSILRLIACSAYFSYRKSMYLGSPVINCLQETMTDDEHYTVELNENFIRLYDENKWTAIFCDN